MSAEREFSTRDDDEGRELRRYAVLLSALILDVDAMRLWELGTVTCQPRNSTQYEVEVIWAMELIKRNIYILGVMHDMPASGVHCALVPSWGLLLLRDDRVAASRPQRAVRDIDCTRTEGAYGLPSGDVCDG